MIQHSVIRKKYKIEFNNKRLKYYRPSYLASKVSDPVSKKKNQQNLNMLAWKRKMSCVYIRDTTEERINCCLYDFADIVVDFDSFNPTSPLPSISRFVHKIFICNSRRGRLLRMHLDPVDAGACNRLCILFRTF